MRQLINKDPAVIIKHEYTKQHADIKDTCTLDTALY